MNTGHLQDRNRTGVHYINVLCILYTWCITLIQRIACSAEVLRLPVYSTILGQMME